MATAKLRASSAPQIFRCPGSVQAQKGLRRKASSDAKAGRKLHRAIQTCVVENKTPVDLGLTGRDAYVVGTFAERTRSIINQYDLTEWAQESRVVIRGFPWTGHPDWRGIAVVRMTDKWTGLIIDYKTGWKPQLPAWTHEQLATYAVLEALKSPELDSIKAWILSAGDAAEEQVTAVDYDLNALVKAEARLREAARRTKDPDAPRVPGEIQCRYCLACGNPERCPESCDAVKSLAIPTEMKPVAPEELGRLLDKWRTVAQIGKRLEEHVRDRIEAGESIPGWEIGEGKDLREITNVGKAYLRLMQVLSKDKQKAADIYLSCCKLSIGDLDRAVWRYLKGIDCRRTQHEAKLILAETVGNLMKTRKTKGDLRRRKADNEHDTE